MYNTHIQQLCDENDISVGNHSRGGRAWRKSRHINIRPVKSAITYCIALHEIGHILGKKQSSYRIEKEVYAWLWAKEFALEWTPQMEKKMIKNLNLYIKWAENRQYRKRPPKIPSKNHILWDLI